MVSGRSPEVFFPFTANVAFYGRRQTDELRFVFLCPDKGRRDCIGPLRGTVTSFSFVVVRDKIVTGRPYPSIVLLCVCVFSCLFSHHLIQTNLRGNLVGDSYGNLSLLCVRPENKKREGIETREKTEILQRMRSLAVSPDL